ncbi:MAG: hypothetical protein ACREQ3_01475, partial [Candidatus Binatia bacterium]
MPHFHATAVFEARGSSPEETDQRAATLFKTLRHPRVLYYEHDTSGGLGPYPPAKARYFTVIADFDVEAQGEERAADMVEEVLDAFSPDDMQYLTHGLTPGEQRVRPEQHAPREADREPERKTRSQRDGQEDRRDRRRGSRGRGRNRDAERETRAPHEQESQAVPTARQEEEPPATPVQTKAFPFPEESVTVTTKAFPSPQESVAASTATQPASQEQETLPSIMEFGVQSPP